jgi:regulatory protein SWI6
MSAAAGHESTPTKEQAMAAKRKRMYNSSLNQTNGANSPLFPPISATVTNAFTALGKASSRRESPAPRPTPAPVASSQGRLRNEIHSQEDWPPPSASIASDLSFSQSQNVPDSAYASQIQLADSQPEMQEPPRKRARAATPVNDVPMDHYYQADAPLGPIPPLNIDHIPNIEHVRQTLMNLFINSEVDAISTLDGLTLDQIDMPLDNMGCAAIHWASSLARVPLIRALITRGASIYRVNDAGETALVRGCFCTNNFDQSTFPQLLNLLHPTIAIADNNGRTILHHIALKSGMKGRSADGRYYLNCLLEFIAKHGASSNTQRGPGPRVMNLGRFITDIVNAQDKSGDTSLNIAARIGNKSIVHPLLEVGADSSIPNRAGLRPVDFGIGGEPAPMPRAREQSWTVPQAVVQKREDIVKCKPSIASSCCHGI